MSAQAQQENDWAEVRNRSGNDDLFIMVDTSLSMSEGAGGIMPQVRTFLAELFTHYLKTGDRVILMTFDSEAHYRSVIDVQDADRDIKLLDNLARGLDARRVISLAVRDGVLREVPRGTPGATLGGGQWSDYCAMWKLAEDAMSRYSDPRRRQLFLLFTDGVPEAPTYRPCDRPEVLETFATGVRKDLFGMGVVALPSGDQQSADLAARLSELLRTITPERAGSSIGNFKVIECDAQTGMGPVRRELNRILFSRVVLNEGAKIDLGNSYKPRLPRTLTVTNQSPIARTIHISSATLTFGAKSQVVKIHPADLKLAPGATGTIELDAPALKLAPGEQTGSLEFFFSSPSRFHPGKMDIHVRQQTWWEAYGRITAIALVVLVLILLFVLLWVGYRRSLEFGPALVEARYGGIRPYPKRMVEIGEQVAFGGGGSIDGELFVDAPGAPRGVLIRDAVDSWRVVWDSVSQSRDYSPGSMVHPDPYATEGWKFMITLNAGHTLSGIGALLTQTWRRRTGSTA